MTIETKKNERVEPANSRETFTGKNLTESQFEESWMIAGIMEREIRRSGSFKEKLGDYAYAFARSEKFDAMKAETIIRDQFKARYDRTMNQMRTALKDREANLGQQETNQALRHAQNVEATITKGQSMPFYRAYDYQAAQLARSLDITETGAKTLMKEQYRHHAGEELYDHCKAIEIKHHRPELEAQQKQHQEFPRQSRARQRG